ncbi:hypothetical protein [Muricauda sp. MAR_2010_75]|uniref:beta strand repeat-containing protein n=1 Tax=Allomuricauda sp. MAR_2010_75 TaxID=1250232 RepID=UPI0012E0AE3A|nr:hypothetical protein [Muricauda sp. MAR_2010_75]
MKTQIVFLIVTLLLFSSLKAQVKIGNNPQNLDPASVLELESSNRVLVITRVTTAQMSTISPLPGALVYNTDEECIHYYNGVEWINICEALDNSFTVRSEAVFNTAPDSRDSTVVVTQTETPDGINYNFEVNQITGDNVYNGTLFGSDLAPQTVGVRELQNGGVGLEKLEDGTLAGQLMQWNGTDWTLISEADISVTELDGVVGNEVTNVTDGTLTRSGAGTLADPYTLGVSTNGISDNEIANDAVTLLKLANGTTAGELMQWNGTDWVLVDPSTLTITEIDGIVGNEVTNATDGTLTRSGAGTLADPYTLGVSTNGISDNEIINDAVTLAKIANGTTAGELMQWNGTDWVLVDPSTLTITETDGIVGNEVTNATDGTLTRSGAGTLADPYTLGVSTNGISDNEIANDAVTLLKLANGTTAGELMQWNGTDWVLVDPSTLTITETDGIVGNEVTNATDGTLTRSGAGTLADPYTLGVSTNGISDNEIANDAVTLLKLANGTTAGELMQWNGTDWVLVDPSTLTITEIDGIVGNEVTNATDGTLTRSGAGTLADPYTLGVSTNGISDNEIINDAVTLAKIANGTTAGELMQWNGTDWVLVDPSTLTITETDGIVGNEVTNATDGTLTRSGAGTLADPYTLDVNAQGIDTDELADDSVTLAKIGTLGAADANSVLTTDVAGDPLWEPRANFGGPAVAGKIDATGNIPLSELNITSVDHVNGTGVYTVNFADLGSTNYVVNTSVESNGTNDVILNISGVTNTSFTVEIKEIVSPFMPYGDSGGDTVNIPETQINPIDKNWSFTIFNF